MAAAGADFFKCRLVVWRSTMADRRDEDSLQGQSIADVRACRLAGHTRLVESPVEPVPASISGEHPPRPVRSMGGRSQAQDKAVSVGIAKVGDRQSPILLILESSLLLIRDLEAPRTQPRAVVALSDSLIENPQGLMGITHSERMIPQRCLFTSTKSQKGRDVKSAVSHFSGFRRFQISLWQSVLTVALPSLGW